MGRNMFGIKRIDTEIEVNPENGGMMISTRTDWQDWRSIEEIGNKVRETFAM